MMRYGNHRNLRVSYPMALGNSGNILSMWQIELFEGCRTANAHIDISGMLAKFKCGVFMDGKFKGCFRDGYFMRGNFDGVWQGGVMLESDIERMLLDAKTVIPF